MRSSGFWELATAWSSSLEYLSMTDPSIVSEETVQIAVIASEAMEALAEYRFETSRSSLASNRILRYPAVTSGGRSAKTTTKPSFQLYAIAKILQVLVLSTATRMSPML